MGNLSLSDHESLVKSFQAGKEAKPESFSLLIDVVEATRSALGLSSASTIAEGTSPGLNSGLVYHQGHLSLAIGAGLKIDANGKLTIDSEAERAIRDDEKRLIEAEAHVKDVLSDTINRLTAKEGRETWEANTLHGGWSVGADQPVELLSKPNTGLPNASWANAAVKLTKGNKPGRIFIPVILEQGVTYLWTWNDARDAYNLSSLVERDRYTVNISASSSPSSSAAEYDETFTCFAGWTARSFLFTPTMTRQYYISFTGISREDNRARGALVNLVQCHKLL